jgi:threonine synthase
MADLKQERRFKVDRDTFASMRDLYAADSVDNAECLATIREVFERDGYLMDPHTAVAYKVTEHLREDGVPVVIASTAHWAKFGNNVYRALHGIALDEELPAEVASLTGCELNKLIASETGVDNVPFGLSELDDLPIRFTEVIDGNADAIKEAVCAFLDFRG